MNDYQQTLDEVHDEIAQLRARVAVGTLSQSVLDAYLIGARQRSDWHD